MPGFVDDKFTNLNTTLANAHGQINDGGTTQGLVSQAKTYFDAGVANTDANAFGCAMNALATAEAHVRGTPAAFTGVAPPGNPNPAGDIDGRLGNLFMTIDVYFLFQPPNTTWPTSNVPPCMTFTATPASVIAPATAQAHVEQRNRSVPGGKLHALRERRHFHDAGDLYRSCRNHWTLCRSYGSQWLGVDGHAHPCGSILRAAHGCSSAGHELDHELHVGTHRCDRPQPISSISVGPAAPSLAAGATAAANGDGHLFG